MGDDRRRAPAVETSCDHTKAVAYGAAGSAAGGAPPPGFYGAAGSARGVPPGLYGTLAGLAPPGAPGWLHAPGFVALPPPPAAGAGPAWLGLGGARLFGGGAGAGAGAGIFGADFGASPLLGAAGAALPVAPASRRAAGAGSGSSVPGRRGSAPAPVGPEGRAVPTFHRFSGVEELVCLLLQPTHGGGSSILDLLDERARRRGANTGAVVALPPGVDKRRWGEIRSAIAELRRLIESERARTGRILTLRQVASDVDELLKQEGTTVASWVRRVNRGAAAPGRRRRRRRRGRRGGGRRGWRRRRGQRS
jgi:hypothetical protein